MSAVARRWQLSSQQVFGWRRAARLALTTASTGGSVTTGFVPIVTEAGSVPTVPQAAAVIEVRLAGAVVRVASGVDDAARLTAVLRAVRASAARS